MPQASDALRAKMDGYFGNGGISDWEPLVYLMELKWDERHGLLIRPPDHEPSQKEWDCVQFLVEEWDYDCVT